MKKLTVAGLQALKGKRKIVLVTAFDAFTARAAEEAGVDMIVAWGADFESTKYEEEKRGVEGREKLHCVLCGPCCVLRASVLCVWLKLTNIGVTLRLPQVRGGRGEARGA